MLIEPLSLLGMRVGCRHLEAVGSVRVDDQDRGCLMRVRTCRNKDCAAISPVFPSPKSRSRLKAVLPRLPYDREISLADGDVTNPSAPTLNRSPASPPTIRPATNLVNLTLGAGGALCCVLKTVRRGGFGNWHGCASSFTTQRNVRRCCLRRNPWHGSQSRNAGHLRHLCHCDRSVAAA